MASYLFPLPTGMIRYSGTQIQDAEPIPLTYGDDPFYLLESRSMGCYSPYLRG